MKGILFNGKHTYRDFGMKMIERKFDSATKNKIKETVPFSNGSYDFTSIFGENTFSDRKLEYTFLLKAKDTESLIYKKNEIDLWFLECARVKLYDDFEPNFYMLAEVENIEFEEFHNFGKIKVIFSSYPFKISRFEEGNDIWNNLTIYDIAQEVKHNVAGTKTIKLYNQGVTSVCPTVVCSSNMQVIKDNVTYTFNAGTSKDWRFLLSKGENDLIIKGNGSIEFKFRKEVL